MASSSWASVGSSLLLFCLVFGMSATVELGSMRKQMQNKTALLIGVGLQFVILPFVGFVVVKSLNLPAAMGITLMVVTSSPGGSYSNWWCSIFNAELALSVTMTALSTLLSTIMLPANLVLYTRWTYDHDVVESLDWAALFLELFVVIGGIAAGMISSHLAARRGSTIMFHKRANVVGNVAGLALITLSAAISSTGNDVKLWSQTPSFYVGVALPAVIGLCIATFLASHFDLDKPERVAVAVEACYQNTGIATSVAITMFRGTGDLNTAISVPLYYGLLEAVMLAGFCLICWKRGWTKAPPDHSLCKVITNSYEVLGMEATESEVAIEVVMGGGSGDNQKQPSASPGRGDMVFSQTDNGAFVVDNEALAATKSNNNQTTESDASTCVSSSTTDEQQPQQQQQRAGGSPPRQPDDAEEPSSSSSEGKRNDDSLI